MPKRGAAWRPRWVLSRGIGGERRVDLPLGTLSLHGRRDGGYVAARALSGRVFSRPSALPWRGLGPRGRQQWSSAHVGGGPDARRFVSDAACISCVRAELPDGARGIVGRRGRGGPRRSGAPPVRQCSSSSPNPDQGPASAPPVAAMEHLSDAPPRPEQHDAAVRRAALGDAAHTALLLPDVPSADGCPHPRERGNHPAVRLQPVRLAHGRHHGPWRHPDQSHGVSRVREPRLRRVPADGGQDRDVCLRRVRRARPRDARWHLRAHVEQLGGTVIFLMH